QVGEALPGLGLGVALTDELAILVHRHLAGHVDDGADAHRLREVRVRSRPDQLPAHATASRNACPSTGTPRSRTSSCTWAKAMRMNSEPVPSSVIASPGRMYTP